MGTLSPLLVGSTMQSNIYTSNAGLEGGESSCRTCSISLSHPAFHPSTNLIRALVQSGRWTFNFQMPAGMDDRCWCMAASRPQQHMDKYGCCCSEPPLMNRTPFVASRLHACTASGTTSGPFIRLAQPRRLSSRRSHDRSQYRQPGSECLSR